MSIIEHRIRVSELCLFRQQSKASPIALVITQIAYLLCRCKIWLLCTKMILIELAIEWRDSFFMSVQNQERHCIIFVVSSQHHSQNEVHVTSDAQKIINRPPLSSFLEWNHAQWCVRGTWKETAHICAKFSTKPYFPRRTARACVCNGSPRQSCNF